MWPKIILFGDSHTQRAFDPDNGCWAAMLADKLQRVCDVVQRGFSGYNTRWCRMMMPKVFGQFEAKEIICVTILLGSNDCVPETSPSGQHVPLEEYRTNLVSMIDYLETIGIEKSKIILMAPPNFHQDDFKDWCIRNNRITIPDTWESQIIKYVKTCSSVATEKKISFLNLHQVFTKVENEGSTNEKLFCDGLHLSKAGAQLLFNNLFPLVKDKVTNFTGKPLDKSLQYPYWMDIDSKDPMYSLK